MLIGLVGVGSSGRAASGQYQLVDLGRIPNGGVPIPTGINSSGEIVGYSFLTTGGQHGFLFDGAAMIDLGTLGGTLSAAYAINDFGAVTGYSTLASGASHAFRYDSSGMTDVGTPAGTVGATGYGINDQGQIVGTTSASPSQVPWLYTGAFQLLQSGGGDLSIPAGINNLGTTVGLVRYANFVQHAVMFRPSFVDLGTLPGASDSGANAVNDSDVIVGASGGHPVEWAQGQVYDLGLLPGYGSGEAKAINADNTVVGVMHRSGGSDHAFILSGGALNDLNAFIAPSAGVVLVDATGVNVSGQIAALGVDSSGAYHAYRLDPPSQQPPPTAYVAMGDSFSSGVGTANYYANTDIAGVNECQRSPQAYAPLLVASGAAPLSLDFVACKGAETRDLYAGPNPSDVPWNEGPQLDHLTADTALVTIGIGGNDLRFSGKLKDCILGGFVLLSCENRYDDDITNALIDLVTPDQVTHLNRLQQLFADIRARAPRAKIVAVDYPHFFPFQGGSDWWSSSVGGIIARCDNIRTSDQLWVNYKIEQIDTAIKVAARTMGLNFVEFYGASDGHERCHSGSGPDFQNGIHLPGIDDEDLSFHPTVYGYSVMADLLTPTVKYVLGAGPPPPDADPGTTVTVMPGQTVDIPQAVTSTSGVGFSSSWPGSDVVMSLRSPSGRVITRAGGDPDVFHQLTPTSELYYVSAPEAGTWTVELYGANVQTGGEPVTLHVDQVPTPNQDPQARLTLGQSGSTVTVDASGSTDPDGQVVRYLWDFDDGTRAVGPVVTHTYSTPGTYRVTLTVADDQDGLGFATAPVSVVVPTTATSYLHGAGATANPPTLTFDSSAPSGSTDKYRDSAAVQFSGGDPWKDIGIWNDATPRSATTLVGLGDVHVWLGLKNSDDQGTQFDLRASLYDNGNLIATGTTRCITGITRNQAQAKEATVAFDSFPAWAIANGDSLQLKLSARIGTNPDNSKCAGPGGSHSNATGLRLYFDSTGRQARFGTSVTP